MDFNPMHKLTPYARQLRSSPTTAEAVLWNAIRRRQLNGYLFRRQYRFDCFIVDFVCLKAKLVIELDGKQHISQANYDANRTVHLNQRGYTVIRFWNHDVICNLENTLSQIAEALSATGAKP